MNRKLICSAALALLTAALAGTALGAELYVVTGRLAPVFGKAGSAKNAPKGGWKKIDFEPPAVLAYGDTVSATPAKGKKGWLSAVDEEGNILGLVEASLLTPMPEYEKFEARPFQVKKDGAVPRLLPGKLPVSDYSKFSLPRGTVVNAEGRAEANGASWLLCSFGTDYAVEDDDAEAAGSDRRVAWLAEDELIDLQASKPDLSKVEESNLPGTLDGDARKSLLKNGFYVDPSPLLPNLVLREDDMVDLYNDMDERAAKFITADLPLHVFHLLFDRALQKVEEKAMIKRTADLIMAMRDAMKRMPKPKSDLERKARANVSGFLAVALHLITNGGSELPDGFRDFAAAVMEGKGDGDNPFTELRQDFSLFGPRGHYTLNDDLKAYFRATYLLGTGWPMDSETGAAATLVLLQLLSNPPAQKRWRELHDPISKLVGSANVNSYDMLKKAVSSFKLADLGKPDRVKALMDALDRAGKSSVIQKLAGKKFAILPRRITFDALIFQTLTEDEHRTLPDPLDVMATLGSKPALDEVKQYDKVPGYADGLKGLADLWPQYSKSADGDNVYTSILSFLRTYFASKGSKQFFAKTLAWDYKKLTTAEGAMTELKHDTILYAEQSGAEMGEGSDTLVAGSFKLPIPRGYVEPTPELFDALGESARKLAATLKPLLPDENEYVGEYYRSRLTEFAESMDVLSAIASRARDDAMTYDDFTTLLNFRMPSAMPEGIYEVEGYNEEGQDMLKMALVADVATDFTGGKVLYMATGTPRKLSVYVNDRSGGFRVTEGYMYSYYTFTRPVLEKRVNDNDWKAEVYDPNAQEKLKGLLPYWHEKIYK